MKRTKSAKCHPPLGCTSEPFKCSAVQRSARRSLLNTRLGSELMSEKFRCERAILFSNLFIFLGAFVVPGFSVCAMDRLSWHYIASIDSSEV